MEAAQKQKPKIACEGRELKNVARFRYLGSIFAADGSQHYDLRRRTGMAASRCGSLRHVLDSKGIPLALKLKIYAAAVVSIMTYGCEAWNLNERTKAQLNGANARCLSRFTGKTAHEEASTTKRTLDMVAAVRKRRHQWLGHILRMQKTHDGKERLVKIAVRAQYHLNLPGNLCADAPKTDNFEELEQMAQNRDDWSKHWESIAPPPPTTTTMPPATTVDPAASPSKGPGRWIGHGVDAVWIHEAGMEVSANDTNTTNTDQTTDTTTERATIKPKRKRKNKKQKKKKKNAGWTDKQRQEWARAHYLEHHGNPDDNLPLAINWDRMVSSANKTGASTSAAATSNDNQRPKPLTPPTPMQANVPADTTTTIKAPTTELANSGNSGDRTPGGTLWAEPAIPPTPTPTYERTPGGTLWAEPAIPPTLSPHASTKTTTTTTNPPSTTDDTTTTRPPQKLKRTKRTKRQLFPTQPR